HRMIAEAVDYANAIEDYELSRQIINDNCEWMRAEKFGGSSYFNRLLANIPEEEIFKDTRILFSKAYTSILAGDFKQALYYYHSAEALIEKVGITPDTLRDRLTIGTGLLFRTEFKRERGGGWLKELLELVAGEKAASSNMDPRVHVLCCLTLQSLAYGDFNEARNYALAAEPDLQHVIGIYCELNFALIELWTNAPDKAREHLERASEAAIRIGGAQSNLKFMSDMFLTVIDYWESDLDADPDYDLEPAVLRTLDGDGGYDVFSIGFDAVLHDALCQKNFDKAKSYIEKLEEATDRLAIERLVQFAQILRLDCAAAQHNLAEAAQLFDAVQSWLDVDEMALENLGWFLRTTAAYSCARYLAAVGHEEEALIRVDDGLAEVDQLDVVLMRVRGNVLKASLLEQAQQRDGALEILTDAIEDAARIGCSRPFTRDVTPDLVREAANWIVSGNQSVVVKDFARKLSASYSKELFTVREKEVLQGLADGQSNKEIARDLDLTDNTVKFHVRNIYRKLEVTKRVNGVAKARNLGLIS
ncbi:helix-turn-helix transcriptional regulator, partial [Parasphingopyxis sp.]|uniref:helix-turn-helix transcriptional regulator n=1 Tax=Parasphingopyxis sp. TaxID=1920299 RepID=UPI002614E305